MGWRPIPTLIILAFVLVACLAGIIAVVASDDVDPSFISRQTHDLVKGRK